MFALFTLRSDGSLSVVSTYNFVCCVTRRNNERVAHLGWLHLGRLNDVSKRRGFVGYRRRQILPTEAGEVL